MALLTKGPSTPPPPEQATDNSPLYRLPIELRTQIYEYVLADSTLSPLFIEGRNVRSAFKTGGHTKAHGTHTALLRTCRKINIEAQPLLPKVHELHLLLRRPDIGRPIYADGNHPIVCSVAELQDLLVGPLRNLSITCEYGYSVFQQHTSVLLLRWICLLLRRREKPLESLVLRCTDDERQWCGPRCEAVMAEIAHMRFHEFSAPAEIVFGPFTEDRAGCACAVAWTVSHEGKAVETLEAEDIFDIALHDLKRVPDHVGLEAWLREFMVSVEGFATYFGFRPQEAGDESLETYRVLCKC
ncbi:hypothetical protein LTR56_013667 [Elasticomyces elasticus]|nr:hypothetical protein LTR56_013667 [Elasticomyces elasticus]KAK3668510.1 hypothetical protein LTR22_000804 [Elasticomyces elasticus]KAK4930801.1 hypothetical protein LTR49_002565 [Elasticomyces elasticus]KAK5748252.1 hypothetical protein LTS12_021715 [Elasticomyces elasticus]